MTTFPVVHINGSSPESLIEALEAADRAIRKAMDAICDTAPNGRDFYPAGPEAINKAIAEHNARVGKMRDVQNEIRAIWESVSDQQDARSSRRAS